MTTNTVLTLTDDQFEAQVLQAPGVTLVDFWAEWCQPCKALGPIIDELASRSDGAFRVGKVNVDDQTRAAAQYGVQSIPTVLVFKGGEVVETLVGVHPVEAYEKLLAPHLEGAASCDSGG